MAAVINDSRYYIANYKRRLLFLFKHYACKNGRSASLLINIYTPIYTHCFLTYMYVCTVNVAIPHYLVCKDLTYSTPSLRAGVLCN